MYLDAIRDLFVIHSRRNEKVVIIGKSLFGSPVRSAILKVPVREPTGSHKWSGPLNISVQSRKPWEGFPSLITAGQILGNYTESLSWIHVRFKKNGVWAELHAERLNCPGSRTFFSPLACSSFMHDLIF